MARLLLMKIYGIDDPTDQFEEIEASELNDYYKHLGCSCFDIARRKIGDKYYDIFVDDIGLFVDDCIVSAIDPAGQPMLVGNLIFANHDEQGNTTSLTHEDVRHIMRNAHIATGDGRFLFRVVCEY